MKDFSGKIEELYDLAYSWKRYDTEATYLIDICTLYGLNSGASMLDVACGTGEHIKFLETHFICNGLDINSEMLAVAKRKLPKIDFHLGDMRNFNLIRRFDLITCLFSSIGYINGEQELMDTLKTFSTHLADDGLIIIEPHFHIGEYKTDTISLIKVEDANWIISRSSESIFHGDINETRFCFVIGDKNKHAFSLLEEVHKLSIFSSSTMNVIANEAGLNCVYLDGGLKVGKGLFLLTKQEFNYATPT